MPGETQDAGTDDACEKVAGADSFFFRLSAAMACAGVFGTLAQVLFTREMLVAFYGNELTLGTLFAAWFVGIGLGALAARWIGGRLSGRAEWVLAIVLAAAGLLLPFQVHLARVIREILGVPMGEYASFGRILAGSFGVFFPSSFAIGFLFPVACDMLARRAAKPGEADASAPAGAAGAVSRIYTYESLGSMAGGAALTFVLLPWLSPFRIVFLATAFAMAGAALVTAPRRARAVLAGLAVALAASAVLFPFWIRPIERRAVEARWRAFGVIGQGDTAEGAVKVRLLRSENSVYQNLAVTESEGQFTLYGNGQVLFVFPDPIGYEHSVHFVMAQNPKARRILLIGGNPVGDLAEILKYSSVEKVVYVELDPAVGRIVAAAAPAAYEAVMKDPRLSAVTEDGPRYVRRCRERFDVVVVHAPEPSTAGANRFYTAEFFRDVRGILAEKGFLYTAVSSSERLQSEAADLGASVYQTLKSVFPSVLVTAEAQNRFLAGSPEARLTFDRLLLASRSESAGVRTQYFRPEYFLGADEITPEKTQLVEERFESAKVPLNTTLRPVTYFYNLMLWNRFSESGAEGVLGRVKGLDYRQIVTGLVLAGLGCCLVGIVLRTVRTVRGTAGGGGWSRCMVGLLMASTGFCGMALEILLLLVFQGLYGYVYSRIGLIVALFMAGLVLGAPCGKWLAGGRGWVCRLSLVGLQGVLAGLALCVPRVAAWASQSDAASAEWLIALLVAAVGGVVGAEFPLANRLYGEAGGGVGVSAAITDATDHAGAAAGALVIGVLLVPLVGIGASCKVLAAMACAGLLCLVSALVAIPIRRE